MKHGIAVFWQSRVFLLMEIFLGKYYVLWLSQSSLIKKKIVALSVSEGSLRRLRDSSVAANTLPQSDINWILRMP